MKRTTLLVLVFVIAASWAMAASPPAELNYQGVLRDTAGTPLTDSVDMVVRFWNAPTGGDEILIDQHTLGASDPVSVKSGLFNIVLGGGALLDGAGPGTYASVSEVFRDYGDVHVGIQVGTDTEMTPRLKVLSTAFALNADRLDGLSSADFALADHGHDGQYLDASGGSLSGSLDLPANGLEVGNGQLSLSSGRVGVGTSAPQNPLHVAGGGGQYTNLADGVHLGLDAVNNAHIELVKSGGSPYIDFSNINSGDMQARIRLAASDRLEVQVPKFTMFANVGVGTATPSNKLHVAGGGLTVAGGSTSSPISLVAGSAPNNGLGGAVDLIAGGGYNDRGGHVTVQSGNTSTWSSLGNSSDVWLRGGTVDGQVSFSEVRVQGGRAVTGGSATSDGGILTLRGGNANGSDRHGGNVILTPGLATGSGTPGRVGVGTASPLARFHVEGGDIRTSGRFVSTASTGTAPLTVDSTTRVDNLNTQFFDGYSSSDFALAGDYLNLAGGSLAGALNITGGGLTVAGGSTSSPISLVAGSAPNNGLGGAVDLIAGGGYNDRGGHVTVQSGNTSTWSSLGNSSDVWLRGGTVDGQVSFAEIRVQGGRAVTGGSSVSDGGVLTLRGGNANGSDRSGGNIILAPGSATGSGAPGRIGVGTTSPQARFHVEGGDIRTSGRFVSTVAGGTAPLSVDSTTRVDNLNAQYLDGFSEADFVRASDLHSRYDDSEALSAMGAKSNANPLHHDRPTAPEIAEAAPKNERIALRKWYAAGTQAGFPAGLGVDGMLFDGDHVWTANRFTNTVTKIRASDGAPLGDFAVGSEPRALAFDGRHVWVGNYSGQTLTKLRAYDGAVMDTVNLGTRIDDVEFDGTNIWVAHGNMSGTVSKVRPSDGAVLASYSSGGACAIGLEFDGTNLWIANWCGGGIVTKMDPASGAILASYGVFTCNDIAFDGENVWITSGNNDQIVKLRASDGANQGTFAVGASPVGVTFDGTHVWVMNSADDTVTRLRAMDGTVVDTFPAGGAPLRGVFDGASIWISNSADGTLNKM